VAHLSNLFSTFPQKNCNVNLQFHHFVRYTYITSLSLSSGQRDISLREVAADSFREEAKPAITAKPANNAVAFLQIQLLNQGISMMYYTIPEVANNHLKVSRSTIYRLIQAGELKLVHFRTCARVPADSLDAYCARRRNVGA
jgi:excisionase family DNA binding protein